MELKRLPLEDTKFGHLHSINEFNQQFQVLIQDLIKIFNSENGLNDIEFGCHYWYLKKNIEVLQ